MEGPACLGNGMEHPSPISRSWHRYKSDRSEGTRQFIHAFPSIENPASNAICRKAGFTFLEEVTFEYPPGSFMRCNDWQLDLFKTE